MASASADAAAGDTILVKYGLYLVTDDLVLNGNRCLGSDDGTHTSWDTALPDSSQCIIAADATCRVMTITGSAVTAATTLRGFTLSGGDATSEGDPSNGYGGGLDINGGADPIVERCRMTGNLPGIPSTAGTRPAASCPAGSTSASCGPGASAGCASWC